MNHHESMDTAEMDSGSAPRWPLQYRSSRRVRNSVRRWGSKWRGCVFFHGDDIWTYRHE